MSTTKRTHKTWAQEAAPDILDLMAALDAGANVVNPRRLSTIYLVASYLYYENDESVMTDEGFDRVCRVLKDLPLDEFVRHAKLINADALEAGSGYHLTGKMPNDVQELAREVLLEHRRRQK